MIKKLCKNELCFLTSQNSTWFKKLYYTIIIFIIDHVI